MRLSIKFAALLCILMISSCTITRPTVTQVVVEPAVFMVAHPLKYKTHDNEHEIIVPAGFLTDLASIPRLLWWWQAPHEKTMAPAMLHDYLYWEQPCEKDEADAVMYQAMLDVGMSRSQANKIYFGIRTPEAKKAWNENKTRRASGEMRFFTERYVQKILDGYADPGATLNSLQADAAKENGLTSPLLPVEEIKMTCKVAYQEYLSSK